MEFLNPQVYKRRFKQEEKARIHTLVKFNGKLRKGSMSDFLEDRVKKIGVKFYVNAPWSNRFYEQEILKETNYSSLRELVKLGRIYMELLSTGDPKTKVKQIKNQLRL